MPNCTSFHCRHVHADTSRTVENVCTRVHDATCRTVQCLVVCTCVTIIHVAHYERFHCTRVHVHTCLTVKFFHCTCVDIDTCRTVQIFIVLLSMLTQVILYKFCIVEQVSPLTPAIKHKSYIAAVQKYTCSNVKIFIVQVSW